LHGELSPTEHRSWSSPIVCRDLRHACKSTGLLPHDFRTRLAPNGSVMEDSRTTPSRILVPSKPGLSSSRTAITNRRSRPEISGMMPVRLTSVRPALAHALRWITNCVAVNDRALSQSVRTTHPFGLLLARSVAGTPDSSQSLFPERLQLAASSRRQLRQPGCDSERFSIALAHDRAVSGHSADPYSLQNL